MAKLSDARRIKILERTPHVRRCLLCKELLDQWALTDDEEYGAQAADVIERHAADLPEPEGLDCQYSGCVLHDAIPRQLALALLRVGRGGRPWRNVKGIEVGTISLDVSAEDHPAGYDMTRQDAVHRHFIEQPPSAGDIFMRMGKERVKVHIWIAPAYTSRHESVQDVAAVWDVVETSEKQTPALTAWCKRKYEELKMLAQMELELRG